MVNKSLRLNVLWLIMKVDVDASTFAGGKGMMRLVMNGCLNPSLVTLSSCL